MIIHAWEERVVEKLIVLSIDGQEQKVVDLGPYYPLTPNVYVMPDRHQGVYVVIPPAGWVHYDPDFNSKMVILGFDWPYYNVVVGWDGKTYTYYIDSDKIYNLGSSQYFDVNRRQSESRIGNVVGSIPLEGLNTIRIVGVDTGGQIYLSFEDKEDNLWLARLDPTSMTAEMGQIPREWGLVTNLRLSPDGHAYSLIFDSTNTNINPKLINCSFQ